MPPKQKIASGIMDVIKNPISTIKEAWNGASKLNYVSTETMQKHGNSPIMAIQIIRTPLNSVFNRLLNAISLGKFADIQKKNGFEDLYHLSLIVVCESGKIIVEKNEVININLFKSNDMNDKTQIMPLKIPANKLTLNKMMDNTLKFMGDSKFYSYDGLGAEGKTNNCQNFIIGILASNNLLTLAAKNFIYQDFTNVIKDMEKQNIGYLSRTVKNITDTAAKVSILMGKGINGDVDIKNTVTAKKRKFIDFVKNDGFRFL